MQRIYFLNILNIPELPVCKNATSVSIKTVLTYGMMISEDVLVIDPSNKFGIQTINLLTRVNVLFILPLSTQSTRWAQEWGKGAFFRLKLRGGVQWGMEGTGAVVDGTHSWIYYHNESCIYSVPHDLDFFAKAVCKIKPVLRTWLVETLDWQNVKSWQTKWLSYFHWK